MVSPASTRSRLLPHGFVCQRQHGLECPAHGLARIFTVSPGSTRSLLPSHSLVCLHTGSPGPTRSRLLQHGLACLHTVSPAPTLSHLPPYALAVSAWSRLPHMVWFASTRVSHASSRSGLAQHCLACLRTVSPAFTQSRLPLHVLASICIVIHRVSHASSRSDLAQHCLACLHTVSPAPTRSRLPPHGLACLRTISPDPKWSPSHPHGHA